METLNKLLCINPNYVLVGLIVVFFSMEMAMIRPINFRGKYLEFDPNKYIDRWIKRQGSSKPGKWLHQAQRPPGAGYSIKTCLNINTKQLDKTSKIYLWA